MSKNVLVTGASGFVGKALIKELTSEGYSVTGFNSSDGDIASVKFPDIPFDAVFHLAGRSFVPDSWKEPEEFRRVNVEGTRNVLEYCKARGLPLYFMSSYVYGKPQKLPISEKHALSGFNPYAQSKIEAEQVCNEYAETHKIPVCIMRPFNIYGPGQPSHFLIPHIINQVLDSNVKVIEVMDLRPKRDFVYLKDLIQAMTGLLRNNCTGVYNIGAGYSVSVSELIEVAQKVAGTAKEVISKEQERPQEVMDVIADISKIKQATGWTPQTGLEQGLREIISLKKA